MTKEKISGPFEVTLNPLDPYNKNSDSRLGRMSVDKQFHGDLEATSKGEMLTAMTSIDGSAAYVAVEHIVGNLRGRKGSFAFAHLGIMNRNVPNLTVVVVPDSGTEELKGLSGKMNVIIENGKHSYVFEYELGS